MSIYIEAINFDGGTTFLIIIENKKSQLQILKKSFAIGSLFL